RTARSLMTIPRFRLQTVMIVVAAVGVLLGLLVEAERLARVSAERRARGMALALEEAALRTDLLRHVALQTALMAKLASVDAGDSASAPRALMQNAEEELRVEREALGRKLDRLAALRRKYEQAARRPWRPVPPDPPGSE